MSSSFLSRNLKYSRRQWDGLIKAWKLQIHSWNAEKDSDVFQGSEPSTSGGFFCSIERSALRGVVSLEKPEKFYHLVFAFLALSCIAILLQSAPMKAFLT